ncbi:MAG: NADP-dependent malic enzyme [Pseudomonadales bacterium]|nr:NADP-dependent malic enzyme [Pseudomonadales bacterium]
MMKDDTFKESALRYHAEPTPGKLAIRSTKPLANNRDLSRAYSPGVAFACELIAENPAEAARMTSRGNLVAVITNGTAVLGLGNIGPLAAKPVMEGKAVLFKKFADIDVFDIEINETDVDKLVAIIAALEPTFGGINLEDIKAPECFLVERKLREIMKIPVFHDDQHGTAIVAAAAVLNGLRVVDKEFADIKLVVSGAGAASIACVELLFSMGVKPENLRMLDRNGVIYQGRKEGMNPWKEKFAVETEDRTITDAIRDADLFLGLSGPGVLTADMVKTMARDPLILAMSNPTPEIMPEDAQVVRPDAIIATGRSDYPNQVNNVLCFPFIFRGALDCGATHINEEMKKACVYAIADLAHREISETVAKAYVDEELKFGRNYLIPKPFDPRLIEEVPLAVVKAAMASGVATRPIEDLQAYKRKLSAYVSSSRLFMQPNIDLASKHPARIVYAEGENEDVLLALQAVVDEGVAKPILIGRPVIIAEKIQKLGLRIQPDLDFEIFNLEQADVHKRYWQYYHHQVGRDGVSVEAAKNAVHTNNTVLAALMVAMDEADGMICGKVGRFDQHLRDIQPIIPTARSDGRLSSICVLLLDDGPLFLADPFVNINPTEDEIVGIAKDAINFVQHAFDIAPVVALLSHSNFGTYEDQQALKMKQAGRRLREELPHVQIDGEMHSLTALNAELRATVYEGANIQGRANVLIMPNMDAASIALGLIRSLTNARLIGPFLCGLEKPAHILIPSVSGRSILNLTALAVADIYARKGVFEPAEVVEAKG